MNAADRTAIVVALTLIGATPTLGQVASNEETDVRIRRFAGLPAETAEGQIRITDVGHHPLDTMLSIVANRTIDGWSVSYACAFSPLCAPTKDHKAVSYILSAQATTEVDSILMEIRSGKEPDGQAVSSGVIGGHLLVSIDYKGLKRSYRRATIWGQTLGRLETLLDLPPE